MDLRELARITGISRFISKMGVDNSIELRPNMSYSEGEWEFYVSKLHGKYLGATKEDLETLKKLAEKL